METDFLSNTSFWGVETDFLLSVHLFRSNFVLIETIRVKSFFYRVNSLLLMEAIFYVPAGESSFSRSGN